MPEFFFQALCSHGDVHGTLSGEYLGDRGNIREKIGVKWLKEKKRHIGIVF